MIKLSKITILFLILLGSDYSKIWAQKMVSFTIDDVPNTQLYKAHKFHSRLLAKIDSLKLPTAIFINEKRLYDTDSLTKNIAILNTWIKDPLIVVGNHGFSHVMYSQVGIEPFKTEVIKGEAITAELAGKYNKSLTYFRFPYNDLGKDEKMHQEATDFLQSKKYIPVPYTVHSEDWLITQLYDYYVSHNQPKEAQRIGQQYVAKTLAYFDYIESLTDKQLNRDVKHIYLLHDNLLNADYLDDLVAALKRRGYGFCSLDEALKDPIYSQPDYYKERYGISWVYRWIGDTNKRKELMRKSPNEDEFEKELKSLKK
ncbi:hypothetical protein GCM10028805_46690 [Spirosoma harenae]